MQEPILSYANGRGAKNIHSDEPDPETGKCKRSELRQEDFLSMDHRAPAMIFDYDEHHGGDDVALWATGKYFWHCHVLFYIITITIFQTNVTSDYNIFRANELFISQDPRTVICGSRHWIQHVHWSLRQ